MDTFNLQEVAEQSLRLLKQGDASAKTVKEYRTTVLARLSVISPARVF
jgi:hypothetical protein